MNPTMEIFTLFHSVIFRQEVMSTIVYIRKV